MKIRNNWKLKAVVAIGGVLIVGAAAAVIPATGTKWQERTFYNASGQAVGGILYDCDGVTRTWGTTSGTMKITQGPCSAP